MKQNTIGSKGMSKHIDHFRLCSAPTGKLFQTIFNIRSSNMSWISKDNSNNMIRAQLKLQNVTCTKIATVKCEHSYMFSQQFGTFLALIIEIQMKIVAIECVVSTCQIFLVILGP